MDYLISLPGLGVCVAILLIPFLPARWKSSAGLAVVTVNGLLTSLSAISSFQNPVELSVHAGWIFGEITFRLDALSSWFVFIINLTCFTGAWYGRRYMSAYLDQDSNLSLHWIMLVLFHYSMILVVSVEHGLAFLVAWEIMSVTSFLLVIFEHSKITTLRAGINYLIQTHIGVLFLTAAFIWTWVVTDDITFTSLRTMLEGDHSFWLFILFFIGFAVKAGFIPVHTWLPHAHPAAPSHISGIMSGVMVTMGIYGILRMSTFVTSNLSGIAIVVFLVSLFTAGYGILSAAIHRDYKRVLAFSTIENMGMIGMGIGMGLFGKHSGDSTLLFLGFGGALLHVLNHSLYKPLLFFASGNLYQLTKTRNMEQLGGLVRKLPLTTFFFLCGALAISGLPPFNGFVSKFLLFSGMIEGISLQNFEFNVLMITGVIGLALVGGLSLLTFTKAFSVIFLGAPRDRSRHQPPEYLNSGHFPLILILFLMLVIALSPVIVLQPLEFIVMAFSSSLSSQGYAFDLYGALSGVGRASLLFLLLSCLLFAVRTRIVARRTIDTGPTWGCGYPAPNNRMQYTGKSFSKSLSKLLPFITSEQKRYAEIPPDKVFPMNRSYESSYAEFFEKNVVHKILSLAGGIMRKFSFIHNGRIQYYILYGLIFILSLIAATAMDII